MSEDPVTLTTDRASRWEIEATACRNALRRFMRQAKLRPRIKGVFFLGGLALLAYVVMASGFTSVISPLFQMRWWFLLALASTLAVQVLRTLAWGLVLGSYGAQVPFASLWRIRLIGEAFNYLSMAGPFLGDPAKAWLLSSETGGKKAATSVACDRLLYSLSSVLFLMAAVSVLLPRSGAGVLLTLAIALAMSPLWVARYTRRLPLFRVYTVIGIHLVSHLFMVLEIGIIFKALHVDATTSQVFLVEVMTKGMHTLFFFVPMQVGVLEGGYGLLLQYLNLGATLGLTIGLARRLRSLFWSGLGLALLWKVSGTSSTSFTLRPQAQSAPGRLRPGACPVLGKSRLWPILLSFMRGNEAPEA